MTTKLTLTIDDSVINQSKKYAKSKGLSLSDMVETYLKSLSATLDNDEEMDPRIKKLIGVITLSEDFNYKAELSKAIIRKYIK